MMDKDYKKKQEMEVQVLVPERLYMTREDLKQQKGV